MVLNVGNIFVPGAGWRKRAACLDADPGLFHRPGDMGLGERMDYRPAAEYCAGCPVNMECLEYAITEPEDYGFYGGFSDYERKKFVRPLYIRSGERLPRDLVDELWRERVIARKWGEAWLDRNPLFAQDGELGESLS